MRKGQLNVKGSIDLIEEAVHLLRRSPFSVLILYYIGSLPFILGFLYFWADMSRSPFAQDRLSESAIAVALLYVWMKCWQTVFAVKMKAAIADTIPPQYQWHQILRLVAAQMILQPYCFIALPLAFAMVLPFAWVYAFYQNLHVVASGEHLNVRSMIKDAWRYASLWPSQNHRLVAVLWLFYIVIFLNVAILILFLPYLLSIFGFENVFSRSGFHVLNTTFVMVCLAITYLSANPLVKVIYVLRCFYGESLESGTDLLAELKAATT